ncbi:hypothetical protein K503DRAFT_767159 [Rhizopogon vinicolor AM-OR11-026]|uniref:F-box domain-containing protein n=1 Tax=Rhizopogon vinicolor AM-OR11-026 TaxID=1314800 RepID=A0A1B7NAX2_9AGAM|nr:hypothetical protein K503DRAFT_767159 [Rhizopogon vinicolor AM-OR11-026]
MKRKYDTQGPESLREAEVTRPLNRPRARKGGLSMLPTVSLDVLFEIFGFLKPLDLLSLARTSKPFRGLLMSKSNAFIWRASRALVPNLPDCPADLCEPQYARLAFDPHCHNCGDVGHNVIWQFRVRYCGPCLKGWTNMVAASSKPVITLLCPNNAELLPTYTFRDPRLRRTEMIQTSQYHALGLQLKGLSRAEQALVIEEAKKAVCAVREHSEACQAWVSVTNMARSDELHKIREERKQVIQEWLEAEGWKPEIDYHTWWKISRHPTINNPRRLTARIWSRVRPILTEYMSELRTIRMEETVYNPRRRILVQAWNDFLSQPASFPNTDVDVLPHVADAALFKPFDDIIKTPTEVVIERDSFLPAFVALPSLARNWRRQVDQQLAAIIMAGYPKDYVPAGDIRQLATSVFVCNACEQLLFWTDAVAHTCTFELNPKRSCRGGPGNIPLETKVAGITHYSLGSTPWSPKFRSSTALATRVIRSCGQWQDPLTVTIAQMDSMGAPFCCLICHPDGKAVMHWRKGLEHNHIHHNQDDTHWNSQYRNWRLPTKYRCLLCRRSVADGRLLRGMNCHIEEQHGISIFYVQEGVHYVKEIDSFLDPVTLLVESAFTPPTNWLSPYIGLSY